MKELASEFPTKTLCAVLEVPRSSVYYVGSPERSVDLQPLKALILTLRATFPRAGVRSMYHCIVSYSTRYSRAQVHQVYVELGLLRRPHPRKPRLTDSRNTERRFPNLLKDLVVERAGQVWVGDVTYVRVGRRFAYLALLMDSFSRMIVGWAVSFCNDTALVQEALSMAFKLGNPEVHHTDQGSTYGSKAYTKILLERGIRVSMAAVGRPDENGQAERLNRTVKEEEAQLCQYDSLQQADESIKDYICIYNTIRLHQALGYRTPAEVFQLGITTP